MNLTQIKNQKGLRNKITGIAVGLNAFCMTSMLAFASGPDILKAFAQVTDIVLVPLESALNDIVAPIAGVALIACFIMMLISQNQKKVEAYRSWCMNIFACIVAIYAVPFIIGLAGTIGTAFKV